MYQVVVDSTEELIPLTSFKEFARVTSSVSSDDLLMETLLNASIDYCEKYTGLSIATKTYERVYKYKELCEIGYENIELRKGVVTEVIEIKKRDRTGDPTIFDITDIEIDNYKQHSDIFVPSAEFTIGDHPTKGFSVQFVAGWTEDTLPRNLKIAIMQLAAYWYENRETAQLMDNTNIAEMPFGTSSILNIYRLVRL